MDGCFGIEGVQQVFVNGNFKVNFPISYSKIITAVAVNSVSNSVNAPEGFHGIAFINNDVYCTNRTYLNVINASGMGAVIIAITLL